MSRKKTIVILAIVTLLLTTLLAVLGVNFNITGHFEGIYLLRDKQPGKYDVTDHLYVGEGQQLIYGATFKPELFNFLSVIVPNHKEDVAHLHVDWSPKDGSGYVANHLPDGTRLVTYFGRYLDEGKEVHGLFVGGGLPDTVATNINYNMNNSGMTYYNGKTWYHIWCSVNEGIDFDEPGEPLTPASWAFRGSKVVSISDSNVVIESSHEARQNSSRVRIERRVSFTAGEPYFNLVIWIKNIGIAPVYYHYVYGDEPWVGYYGTSLGDVGWVNDRIITHEEVIDSSKYSYAGMADLGNRAIGEQPVYTNLANFIEWTGEQRPKVYFSNDSGSPERHPVKTPLDSNERFIGLQWDKSLLPGDTQTIRLNIGMAAFNQKTGIPVKPPTTWK